MLSVLYRVCPGSLYSTCSVFIPVRRCVHAGRHKLLTRVWRNVMRGTGVGIQGARERHGQAVEHDLDLQGR